ACKYANTIRMQKIQNLFFRSTVQHIILHHNTVDGGMLDLFTNHLRPNGGDPISPNETLLFQFIKYFYRFTDLILTRTTVYHIKINIILFQPKQTIFTTILNLL